MVGVLRSVAPAAVGFFTPLERLRATSPWRRALRDDAVAGCSGRPAIPTGLTRAPGSRPMLFDADPVVPGAGGRMKGALRAAMLVGKCSNGGAI